MSVYVTAHGRYTGGTTCKKHSILDDPVRVRKNLENERRIQRLRQVREESNNLARKIRQEVDEEKNRQLKTLEAIKTKELKCWREHVLAKKNDDYHSAVYQVGAAHRAAMAENEEREKQKEQQQRKQATDECRRRQALKEKAAAARPAKKSKVMNNANCCECRKKEHKENKKTKSQPTVETVCCGCHSNKDKVNRNLATEETCMSKSEERSQTKRKRNTGCGVSKNCSCRYSDDSQDDICSVSSSDTTTTSSLHLWQDSESSNGDESGENEGAKSNKKCLQKTPALILDLDVDSDDIVTVTTHGCGRQQQQQQDADVEINDNHVDINRRFCRVIQNSSEQSVQSPKGRSETETKSSSTTNGQSSEPTKKPTRLRFTQISELIKRSSTTEQGESQETTTATTTTTATLTQSYSTKDSSSKIVVQDKVQRISKSPPIKVPIADQTNKSAMKQVMQKAPPAPQRQSIVNAQKTKTVPPSQKSTVIIQRNKTKTVSLMDKNRNLPKTGGRSHATEATLGGGPSNAPESHSVAATTMPCVPAAASSPGKRSLSTTTVILQHGDGGGTVPCSSGRVQFYDYNNKFEKEYQAQSARSIKSTINDDTAGTQLNAMDHAEIENQLQILRKKEIDKLRQINEERGRKALEREQVRRDCEMLTEKLDALQREHPHLLANDANFMASHRFVDLSNRREKKMDELMEEMLLRPAIITCPAVTPSKLKSSNGLLLTTQQAPSTVNVGDHWGAAFADNATVSSESCTTILLDSVDNQTKQLRKDIKENGQLDEKAEKLTALLRKVETIRENLIKELQTGDGNLPSKFDGESGQQLIEAIRQERANILSEKEKSLQARESELLKHEAMLDKKIKEAYDVKRLQDKQAAEEKAMPETNKKKCSSRTKMNADGQQVLKHSKDKPLEIIIKVTGDGIIKECTAKTKDTNGLDENVPSITKVFNEELKQPEGKKSPVSRARQNSYDSNSTDYRSLPPELNNQVHAIIEELTKPKQSPQKAGNDNAKSRQTTTETEPQSTTDASPRKNVNGNINILDPIICQYVQRLLGMTRNSIQELAISSSDQTTPSSSLINTLSNISQHNSTFDESLIDEKNIQRIQSFIEDNRSFVSELEDTLRTHSTQSLEKSLRAFDVIWNQRLKKNTNHKKSNQSSASGKVSLVCPCPQERKSAQSNNAKCSESKRSAPSNHLKQDENLSGRRKQQTTTQQPYQRCDVISIQSSSSAAARTQSSEQQMDNFVKMTENCTQRISQLTDLIHKVREEKQRLMEVTLTSEGERNSTEYFDLPQGNKPTKSTEPRSRTISDQSRSSDTMPLSSEVEPLQKYKAIGISCDSGIFVSRPITSHGHYTADPEIQSTNPTTTTTMTSNSYYTSSNQRRSPPLTHAHDLSTIAEVDTPMPSAHHHNQHSRASYNNSNSTLSDLRTLTTRKNIAKHCEPIRFPTFEQYAEELNLDVTSMNTEQTIRLEHQFRELIIAINEKCDRSINYQEFPTIGSYLHNMTATRISFDADDTIKCNSPKKIRELIERFKLATINVRSFPTPREYMHQIMGSSQGVDDQLFDTSSLENLSDPKYKCCSTNNQKQHRRNHSNGATTTDTESFNVEAELKKRKILKNSFQRDRVSSSTQLDSAAFYAGSMPCESGIERLSSSQNDSTSMEIDRDLQRLGMQWPTTMRQRQREADALSSGSNKTAVNSLSHRRHRKRHNKEGESIHTNATGEIGRTLNLREFLTKELLKHANNACSTSSEDSLKSNFLNSVIDSLTPNGGTVTAITLERQKTSTPVVSTTPRSGRGKRSSSSTSSKLFSGESHLSSVRDCRQSKSSTSTSSTTSTTSKSSSSKHTHKSKSRM